MPNKKIDNLEIENAKGRWALRTTLVSGAVAVTTSLLTLLATSANLREAGQRLDTSTREAKAATSAMRSSTPLGTLIPSLLTPQQFEQLTGISVQDTPDKSQWVLADGRPVRGSDYAKVTGQPYIPNLVDYRIQDVMVTSGTISHGQSLLKNLDKSQLKRDWTWMISLRATDPTTGFGEWEQRVQKLTFSSDDPKNIIATAQIFDGKNHRFAPATPSTANYFGLSVASQRVYWYIKINYN
jgi:hypothetical protein